MIKDYKTAHCVEVSADGDDQGYCLDIRTAILK